MGEVIQGSCDLLQHIRIDGYLSLSFSFFFFFLLLLLFFLLLYQHRHSFLHYHNQSKVHPTTERLIFQQFHKVQTLAHEKHSFLSTKENKRKNKRKTKDKKKKS